MYQKKGQELKFEFCFSYQMSKTFRDSKSRLKNTLDTYLSKKKISWKNIYFSERYDFFTRRQWMRTLNHCDSSQIRDPKPRLGRKIITFDTGIVFSWNFFDGSIQILKTCLSGPLNCATFYALGTRSKATLSKWILTMLLCFSYLSGERHQKQNYALNTFLGCVSIQ